MPARNSWVREHTNIHPTPKDAGLEMTLTVTAYDNGMLKVDGRPISQQLPGGGHDPAQSWTGTAEYLMLALAELQRQVATRQQNRAGRFISGDGATVREATPEEMREAQKDCL